MAGQALEYQFAALANNLLVTLMNWEATNQQLQQDWQKVISLRSRCMQAYGGKAAKGSGAVGPGGQVSWKMELFSAFGQQTKRPMEKDEILFQTQLVEGSGYYSTVTSAGFRQPYTSGQPSQGKKEAEHLAAQAAMQVEFPDYYQKVNGSSCGAMAQHVDPMQGQKRKAAQMQAESTQSRVKQAENPAHNAKGQLVHAAQLLTGRVSQKGDIVYEVATVNDKFVATVRLPCYDPSLSYQGLPKDYKKEAEMDAAQAALRQLEDTIAPLQEALSAKKANKAREFVEKIKERTSQQKLDFKQELS